MIYDTLIGGRKVSFSWDQQTAKRHSFRCSLMGGHPTDDDTANPATADAAVFKMLWAILPHKDSGRYKTPEDLYYAVDPETENEALIEALAGVYSDMKPTPEKKRTSKKSPSLKSN